MRKQEFGWLYIVSNKALNNYLQVYHSSHSPEYLIERLNKVSRFPSFKVEYKEFVSNPRSIHEKIHKMMRHCRRREWYDCPLPEITSIINDEILDKSFKLKEKAFADHGVMKNI